MVRVNFRYEGVGHAGGADLVATIYARPLKQVQRLIDFRQQLFDSLPLFRTGAFLLPFDELLFLLQELCKGCCHQIDSVRRANSFSKSCEWRWAQLCSE